MDILNIINTNKFVAGLAMIAMNYGSRFVTSDVTKFQEQVLQSEIAKKFVLFCIFFVATRDVMVASMLTFAFYVVVNGMLNEHKKYNILGALMQPFGAIYEAYDTMVDQATHKKK
jgi:hypothetical protein